MDKVDFDNRHWGAGEMCSYCGILREVCSISFKEGLIGLVEIASGCDDGDVEWVRCESVVMVEEDY